MDLLDPENRRKLNDARFIDRVFTPAERDCIAKSRSPLAMLWSTWACKEAAYKALSKVKKVTSSPSRYAVTFLPPLVTDSPGSAANSSKTIPADVITPEGRVPVRTCRERSYVHAIALVGAAEYLDSIIWSVSRIRRPRKEVTPAMQSFLVRRQLKLQIAQKLAVDPGELEITRPAADGVPGPPLLLVSGEASGIDISLAHDGPYLAYAFAFRANRPGAG